MSGESLLAPRRILWPGHPLEDTMSTQADHGHELIPRPEQTPDALRAALAVASRSPAAPSCPPATLARRATWSTRIPSSRTKRYES
ncbi:hypothetical protein QBA57_19615 [Streptomyces scabiei]|uniref:hypothetical protein n=1 Tax=Streptomyces scabiei TaxID=1930 RepID=UPI000AA42C50|nr:MULTISPECIES: hypothetical protein [Streptomyces]MDW8474328.1 hypothetical protein [Streptomyces scabiei]MDX2572943.1 hypothetical protein [Streptomyces scabiei]MDX2632705.1 hypothetical protein [Streptomyces scabiei]MDX3153294.1 hypothetical protein [Streptomyces scabiei]MDX3158985.1 hypothetical protein [Streptomyces scabiei]